MEWQVALTMVATTLGLVAFAAAIERYFFRKATILETGLFVCAAAGLLWPAAWCDAVGFLAFITAVALQKWYTPQSN